MEMEVFDHPQFSIFRRNLGSLQFDLHQAIRALLLAARVMVLPEFATYCVSNQSQIGVKTHLINGA